MQNFFEWYTTNSNQNCPWLILGKGPSFEKHRDFDLSGYQLMSLNHVVEQLPVTAAHIIDLDVVSSCHEAIDRNAKFLVMPWIPHVDNRPGELTLAELVRQDVFLDQLDKQGRLLFYDHLQNRRSGKGPLVRVHFFSSEAAIDLLAKAGVDQIRTLGVDGGTTYGASFGTLSETTLLANGRKSFNKQFGPIAQTILETGADVAPLDIESPIRVYVATTEEQMLAVRVLEYSIRKHASMTVEVHPLHLGGISIPTPQEKQNWPRTPFSFQRFLIPRLAGHQGRAIYLDSDMQVFRDIRDIWTLPFKGSQLLAVAEPGDTGRRPQFSVMLLDCGALDWDIEEIVAQLDSGALSYERLMYDMAIAKVRADIDSAWNCLERFDPKETALLHYTDMSTQPWVSTLNPLAYLWFRDLFEALECGAIDKTYIRDHVDRGYLRPSLWYQIEHGIEDPLLLPRSAKKLDASFTAAFKKIHSHGALPWTNQVALARSIARDFARRTGATAFLKRVQARFDRS